MKELFSAGVGIPLARALREHRAWLVPLGIVLVVNAGVLLAVVLPLSRVVTGNEQREQAARQALIAAERDVKNAEALRDGKAQATTDLDLFYRDVLPKDVSAARRLAHVKLANMANSHDVTYERGSTSLQRVKESALERVHVTMALTGEYADIRAFLHELETAGDFVVIDNMVITRDMDEKSRDLSVALEVSTYYRSQAGTNTP